MKILITGITGFVGEYLANEISKNNPDYKIFGIDKIKKPFCIFPELNKKVRIYECDITKKATVAKTIKIINPDQVYHLAGYSSSRAQDEALVYKINVLGTLNILKALHSIKKQIRILLVSSSHVYGITEKQATEKSKTKPVGIYGQSKLEMEKQAHKFLSNRNLEIIIVRSSNHTGAGQRQGFLVPDTVNKILISSTNTIEIRNPGAKREISDVRDVVQGYVLVMLKGKKGEIYNIGSGKAMTVKTIAKMIISLSGKKIKIHNIEENEKLPVNSVNPSKIKKLGWKPKYTLLQTIKSAFNYYKKGNSL